ncbi:hypothetical protein [Thermoflavimicrobium dichotomicum]|uniref:Uncharacterized protein n=1 Tax=Thermoflavimicrobium dichotomicum TaxID=46223 RepID=A0A1I3SVT8_9BACL|nr:hypothetical protein [Thermoflavimicrobium dichotomicum]SFJ61467.1 hypothetical protein SAMN05421852_11424 [Thermoflavimicrobium dichotomicum]
MENDQKETRSFQANNNKGQINYATDHAKIDATMITNIGHDGMTLSDYIEELFTLLEQTDQVSTEDKEVLRDLLETVDEQSGKGQPRKTIVNQALDRLSKLSPLFVAGSGTGQVISAITDILDVWK